MKTTNYLIVDEFYFIYKTTSKVKAQKFFDKLSDADKKVYRIIESKN